MLRTNRHSIHHQFYCPGGILMPHKRTRRRVKTECLNALGADIGAFIGDKVEVVFSG
jgi:hypothetical protein